MDVFIPPPHFRLAPIASPPPSLSVPPFHLPWGQAKSLDLFGVKGIFDCSLGDTSIVELSDPKSFPLAKTSAAAAAFAARQGSAAPRLLPRTFVSDPCSVESKKADASSPSRAVEADNCADEAKESFARRPGGTGLRILPQSFAADRRPQVDAFCC